MMPNYKLSLASWAACLKICKELITGKICKYSPDGETVGDTGLLICKGLITGKICKYSPDQETVGDTGLLGA